MILSSSQLRALKERNDEELRKGKHGKYGYPAHTIQDLLLTIEAVKKEKKKWKQLAQERGPGAAGDFRHGCQGRARVFRGRG